MRTLQTAQSTNRTPGTQILDRAAFIEAFGTSFRNGNFLAARAFDAANAPLSEAASIFAALRDQFYAASEAERLSVLRAYTPLNPGINAARIVMNERQSSGLQAMTASQQARLLELLVRYARKFGFDAIFVVRNYTTASLLAALESRVLDEFETEMRTTYKEVELLAQIHIEARFST